MDPRARVGLLRAPVGKLNDRKVIDPWDMAHLLGLDAIHPHFTELLLYNGADMLIGDYPDRMVKIRAEMADAPTATE